MARLAVLFSCKKINSLVCSAIQHQALIIAHAGGVYQKPQMSKEMGAKETVDTKQLVANV